MDNRLRIRMLTVVLDCKEPHELADFYAALLGWTKWDNDPEWIGVSASGKYPYLLFQQVSDYVSPVWPDAPEAQRQMVHIDFGVSDLDAAVKHAIRCGAIMPTEQYSDKWTVLFDPAGHPFCLCRVSKEGFFSESSMT